MKKNVWSGMIRLTKTVTSLILCMMLLLSLMPLSLADGDNKTIYGDAPVDTTGIDTPKAELITDPQQLLDWCVAGSSGKLMDVTFLVDGKEIGSEPLKWDENHSAKVGLSFKLKDEVRTSIAAGCELRYTLPSNLDFGNASGETRSKTQEHLANWSIQNGVLSVTMTEEFYKKVRENVEMWISLDAGWNMNSDNREMTFSFDGGSDFTIQYEQGRVTVKKLLARNAYFGNDNKLYAEYAIQFVALDETLDQVVIKDTMGDALTYLADSAYLQKVSGGVGVATDLTLSVSNEDKTTTFTISGGKIEAGVTYNLHYKGEVDLTTALTGGIKQSVDIGKNTASLTWMKNVKENVTDEETIGPVGAYTTYDPDSFVTLTKKKAAIKDGQFVFTITLKVQPGLQSITLTEMPGTLVAGGSLYTQAGELVSPDEGTTDQYTIENPSDSNNGTHVFEYRVDIDPEELGANNYKANTATNDARTNVVKATWTINNEERSIEAEDIISLTKPANIGKIVPNASQVGTSNYIWITNSNGETDYLYVKFRVEIVKNAALTGAISGYAIQDQLSSLMTLVTDGAYAPYVSNVANSSVKVYLGSTDMTQIAAATESTGAKWEFNIPGYDPNKAWYLYYTVRVSVDDVLAGKLASTAATGPRQNKATGIAKITSEKTFEVGSASATMSYGNEPPIATLKKANDGGVKYDAKAGKYYTNFKFTLKLDTTMDQVVLRDPFGDFFQKTAPTGWAADQVKITYEPKSGDGTDPRPSEGDVVEYDSITLKNTKLGTYTIILPVYLNFRENGLTYYDVVGTAKDAARTNYAELDYTRGGVKKTIKANAITPFPTVNIEKSGELQKDEEEKIATQTVTVTQPDGTTVDYTCASIDWTIKVWASDSKFNLIEGGTLLDQMTGRQGLGLDGSDPVIQVRTSASGTWTDINLQTYGNIQTGTVGTQVSNQFFDCVLSGLTAAGVKVDTGYLEVKYTTLVRLPSVPTDILAGNRATFRHPEIGDFTAQDYVDIEWGGGTGGPGVFPATIQKNLIGVSDRPQDDTAPMTARWEITVNIDEGVTIENVILTDYLNFISPDTYFKLDDLNLEVKYIGEDEGPKHDAPYVLEGQGGDSDRLFIKFIEPISKSFIVRLTTQHDPQNFKMQTTTYINYADLQYDYNGNQYNVIDNDKWTRSPLVFEKTTTNPPGTGTDKTPPTVLENGKYVADWAITMNDATRVGREVVIVDTLPVGMTYVPDSLAIAGGTLVSAEYVASTRVLTITFKAEKQKVEITLRSELNENRLHITGTYQNTAQLKSYDKTKTDATAYATVKHTGSRSLTKGSSEVKYYDSEDAMVITWTVELKDKSRMGKATDLLDTLPEGLELLSGSLKLLSGTISESPVSSCMGTVDENNRFLIRYTPTTETVKFSYQTKVTNAYLEQQIAAGKANITVKNVVALMPDGWTKYDDLVLQSSKDVSISTDLRSLAKHGTLYFEDGQYYIRWLITLTDDLRKNTSTIMKDVLPEGTLAADITSIDIRSSENAAITPTAVDRTGDVLTLTFTPTTMITYITLIQKVDSSAWDFAPGAGFVRTYLNTIKLMSHDGETDLLQAQDSVIVSEEREFEKTGKLLTQTLVNKPVIEWTMVLTAESLVGKKVILKDLLPEGVTYVEGSATAVSTPTVGNAANVSVQAAMSISTDRLLELTFIPAYAKTTVTIKTTINSDYIVKGTAADPWEFINKADVWAELESGTPTDLILTDDAKVEHSVAAGNLLTKSGSQIAGTNTVKYTFHVNKLALDLAFGQGSITLTDVLPEKVSILPTSIKVYKGTTTQMLTGGENGEYSAQYNPDNRTMTVVLPNKQYVRVEFLVILLGNVDDKLTIVNNGSLSLEGVSATTGNQTFTIVNDTSGIIYDTSAIQITKIDAASMEIVIQGAEFTLFEVNYTTGAETEVAKGNTDIDGALALKPTGGVKTDTLYCLRETAAAPNYDLNAKNHYFLLKGENATAMLAAIEAAGYEDVDAVDTPPQYTVTNARTLISKLTVWKKDGDIALGDAVLRIYGSKADADSLNEASTAILEEFTSSALAGTTFTNPTWFDESNPGKTYYLAEKTPPAGYLKAAPVAFVFEEVVNPNNAELTYYEAVVQMQDEKPDLSVAKRDSLSDALLSGAQLRLHGGETDVTWNTGDANGNPKVFNDLDAGVVYTLEELLVPSTYYDPAPSETVKVVKYFMFDLDGKLYELESSQTTSNKFEIDPVNGINTFTLENDPIQVVFKKVDDQGTSVIGAQLELYEGDVRGATQNEIPYIKTTEWTITNNEYRPTKPLKRGAIYTLHEVAVPLNKGYFLAADMLIEVLNQNEVFYAEAMVDNRTKLQIVKQATGNDPTNLEGAEFIIYRKDDVNKTVIRKWESKTTPEDFTGVLLVDVTYVVEEVKPPKGYLAVQNGYEFTLTQSDNDSEVARQIIFKDEPIDVEILKVDESGEPLEGVELELYKQGTNTALFSWTTETVAYKPDPAELEAGATYFVHEKTPLPGYLNTADISFTIPMYRDENKQSQTIQVEMINSQTEVQIIKYDEATDAPVSGATLRLMDATNTNQLDQWVSDGTPHSVPGLEAGKQYHLLELQAPTGFVKSDMSFTIPADYDFAEGPYVVRHMNQRNYEFRKEDAQGEPVEGAKLQIYDLTDKKVVAEWTSGKTPYNVVGKLKVGHNYELREIEAPKGYVIGASIPFSLNNDGSLPETIMVNVQTEVQIIKYDEATDAPVSGATLRLMDATNTNQLGEWVSDGTPHSVRGLEAGKQYHLLEIQAPTGFVKSDMSFTIPADYDFAEGPYVVRHMNQRNYEFRKEDAQGEPVEGAKLQIYDLTDKKVVAEWTSGKTPYNVVGKLKVGHNYELREIEAPKGYVIGASIPFSLNNDGSLPETIMVNVQTEVQIIKYDEATNAPLSGATLRLMDATNTNQLDQWVSDGTPHSVRGLEAGKQYRLQEIQAPTGFIKRDMSFTIPANYDFAEGAYVVRHMNQRTYEFRKVDEQGVLLAGARLQIYDLTENKVVVEWTSGTTPFNVTGRLKVGHRYELREVQAPLGYVAGANIPFTLNSDGSLPAVTMVNIQSTVETTPPPGPETVTLTVNKTWDDYDNASGMRPAYIVLNLYQKLRTDADYPAQPMLTVNVYPNRNARNNWVYRFVGLPAANNRGVRYDYNIVENPVPGYQSVHTNNGLNILNYTVEREDPTPTPFATPTPPLETGFENRVPVGVRYVDGEWVYIDEDEVPLGIVPLTGDTTNWLLWVSVIVVPLLVAGVALYEIHRRKRRQAKAK